jgi:hypothetical protein
MNRHLQDRRGGVDLNPYGVAIGRGEGIVARTGDVVMFVADAAAAAPLLLAIDSAAAAQSPGQALAKALATIALGPDSALIPPFGVLAPTGEGLLVMLRGHVAADIEADGVSRSLAGDRALTWVDEIVQEPVDKIVIGGDVSGLIACPHTNLRDGVVPGGGFVVHREQIESETRIVPSHNGERAQPDEHRRHAAPSSGEVLAPPAQQLAPPAQQLPAPTQQLPAPARPVGAPARKPALPTAMAGPVIGALADEDDAVYLLDRPYVIGRNPLIDKAVQDALASPIVVPDDPQVSRVHAYVTVEAGAVLVRDAGTPGGTYLAAPGDASWIRVGDQPTEIKPGWYLRVGQRILVYQKQTAAE